MKQPVKYLKTYQQKNQSKKTQNKKFRFTIRWRAIRRFKIVIHLDFNDRIDGWSYGSGWDSTNDTTIRSDQGGLKISTDYSNDLDLTWHQRTVIYEKTSGLNLSETTNVIFELTYNENMKTTVALKQSFIQMHSRVTQILIHLVHSLLVMVTTKY